MSVSPTHPFVDNLLELQADRSAREALDAATKARIGETRSRMLGILEGAEPKAKTYTVLTPSASLVPNRRTDTVTYREKVIQYSGESGECELVLTDLQKIGDDIFAHYFADPKKPGLFIQQPGGHTLMEIRLGEQLFEIDPTDTIHGPVQDIATAASLVDLFAQQ